MTHADRPALAWLDDLWRDLIYAIRTLGKAPAFTAAAVVTLALGIGAVTVIYSVVHNVVVDPLPYRDADRLVALAACHLPRAARCMPSRSARCAKSDYPCSMPSRNRSC
jgi:hypothetical protein